MSKIYKHYHSSSETTFISLWHSRKLRDNMIFSWHWVSGWFYLKYVDKQQEMVDNNRNNNNNWQSFHFVLGPVLSNLHALLYCITHTIQWRLERCFLRSENLIAFCVMVVNILTATLFLMNTCKLRQHIFMKVLLKTQLALNAVSLFKYFLHLEKKQWEHLI